MNGEIAATTPTGTRSVNPSLPVPATEASMGTTSPAIRRASAAENAKVSTARRASPRAVAIGLAASHAMARAKCSSRVFSAAAVCSSTRIRSARGKSSRSRAVRAAATARFTSWGPAAGTRATTDPS